MPPEVWLRGAVDGIAPLLQPAAHSLLQVREEVEQILPTLTPAQLATRPAGVASTAFHARHLAASTDRLLTYARGESLDDAQHHRLAAERSPEPADPDALLAEVLEALDAALAELRAWSQREEELLAPREVGRARLPSTVLGLLFHTAEHAQRHAGQMATTARIVRGDGH